MVIDFHTHNFPDHLARRAIDGMLAHLNGVLAPVGDGTLARQLADMARAGVDRAVMCPIATRPEQADVILRRACAIRDGAEGTEAAARIIPFASVHPSDPGLLRHLKAIVRAGIRGIKLHPYYQRFALQDPAMVPFFAAVRAAGLVVVCHCGQDPGFPAQRIDCGPAEIAALLRAVPGLAPRFVAAHLGGFVGAAAGAVDELLDLGCWLDTAVLAADLEKPEPRRLLATWPAERLLFATDYYWTDERQLIDWVTSLRGDSADREAIFHANAERLLAL